MARAFSISGRISSTSGALLLGIFLTTPVISASDMDKYSPGSSDSASSSEDLVSWIKELLKVFFPPGFSFIYPCEPWSAPERLWSPQIAPFPGHQQRSPKRPGILSWRLVLKHKGQSEISPRWLSVTQRWQRSSPTLGVWFQHQYCLWRWAKLYLVGTSLPPVPASAPSPPERWHSTYEGLVCEARGQDTKARPCPLPSAPHTLQLTPFDAMFEKRFPIHWESNPLIVYTYLANKADFDSEYEAFLKFV